MCFGVYNKVKKHQDQQINQKMVQKFRAGGHIDPLHTIRVNGTWIGDLFKYSSLSL